MKHFAESEAACHIIAMGEVKDSWNVVVCFQEIEEMDADDIMARQVEQLDREKREMQMKLKLQEKRVDHFERAKRLEEIPLLTKQYEEFVVADKEFWDQEQEEKVTYRCKARKQNSEAKILLEVLGSCQLLTVLIIYKTIHTHKKYIHTKRGK
jgi:hypothetical protein